jgi:hypothetical protein
MRSIPELIQHGHGLTTIERSHAYPSCRKQRSSGVAYCPGYSTWKMSILSSLTRCLSASLVKLRPLSLHQTRTAPLTILTRLRRPEHCRRRRIAPVPSETAKRLWATSLAVVWNRKATAARSRANKNVQKAHLLLCC